MGPTCPQIMQNTFKLYLKKKKTYKLDTGCNKQLPKRAGECLKQVDSRGAVIFEKGTGGGWISWLHHLLWEQAPVSSMQERMIIFCLTGLKMGRQRWSNSRIWKPREMGIWRRRRAPNSVHDLCPHLWLTHDHAGLARARRTELRAPCSTRKAQFPFLS